MKIWTMASMAASLLILIGCQKENEGERPVRVTLAASYPGPFVLEAGKEYLISGDVVFEDSLRMDAGTKLTALGGYQISVLGPLLIDGNATSPVRLSTSENFLGIRASGSSTEVRDLIISGEGQGFVVRSDQCTIQGLDMQSCDVGMWISNSQLNMSELNASNCREAIRIEQCTVEASGLVLVNCDTGVSLSTTTGSLSGSRFESCQTGIASNTGDAVLVSRTDFAQNVNGITYFYGRPNLTLCTFDSNQYSVNLRYYPRWDVTIQQCNFLNPGSYNLAMENITYNNPHSLDISGNWWGGATVDEIAESIRDGIDTGRADTLVFLPTASASWVY